jgi:alpha-L-rhamnosidase
MRKVITGYRNLFTGVAPPALRANMVDRLVKDIEAHGNHLTTGFLGTPFLMFVLDESNRSDVAFKLLLSDTYPSWGYMVKKGATTWWERWNGDTGDPAMNSYNHYAFGSVMAWVYRRAAGIDTDATIPGYHHLTIRPHFDPALSQLHTEYDSAYGTIVSDWQQSMHQFTITMPANTTGTVILPNNKPDDWQRDTLLSDSIAIPKGGQYRDAIKIHYFGFCFIVLSRQWNGRTTSAGSDEV